MKTTDLVIGLIQVIGAIAMFVLPTLSLVPEGNVRAVFFALVVLGCCVNAWFGVRKIMTALFGKGGLVCELFPRLSDE